MSGLLALPQEIAEVPFPPVNLIETPVSIIQTAWFHIYIQINPFTRVVALPQKIFSKLDAAGRNLIAKCFMGHVKCDVIYVRDAAKIERYFLGPVDVFTKGRNLLLRFDHELCPYFLQPALMDASKETIEDLENMFASDAPRKIAPKKLPRPPNAYIMYRNDNHRAVKEEFPDINNTEISKILGARWRRESLSVRQSYKDKSDDYKNKFLEQNPDYRYRPRKVGEKKRRAKRTPQVNRWPYIHTEDYIDVPSLDFSDEQDSPDYQLTPDTEAEMDEVSLVA